ncbi:MAG: antibiotic biosynthesis monooxygenase [Bacteroidetes bacterium]|nr:antibiotic biosynthesis monooxygenase [Bacteroidota bacterium]
MIVRVVKLTIQPQLLTQFLDIYLQSQENIKHFEGCVELNVFHDYEKPNILFTISKWEHVNHLEAYRNSPFFKKVWTAVKPMFAAPAIANTLTSFS